MTTPFPQIDPEFLTPDGRLKPGLDSFRLTDGRVCTRVPNFVPETPIKKRILPGEHCPACGMHSGIHVWSGGAMSVGLGDDHFNMSRIAACRCGWHGSVRVAGCLSSDDAARTEPTILLSCDA